MFAISQNIWCLLGLLLLLAFETSDAVDYNCDYQQTLQPGQTYYIRNSEYPNNYKGAHSCRWHAISNTRVRLTCTNINIPSSQNCVSDSIDIYTNPTSPPRKYCGTGSFNSESEGNEMIITLTTVNNTPGGKFTCQLEATEEAETCTCGWKNPSRIVGGVETGVNEYPMMAAIINVATKQVFCGATIISNKHVLTAAHCLATTSANNLGILVGDHDLSTGQETSASRLYRVANFVVHPYYVSSGKDYDIAVIAVTGTIVFSNQVGPACLPFQHNRDSFTGSFVDVLGWGMTEFAGAPSNTLQKVRLSIPNLYTCQQYYPNLSDRQICTYAQGRDACQFDSGGPVLWQDPTTRRLVLAGIISYGRVCANNEPAVNTRVGSFVDWIIQVTPGTRYCQAE